MGEARTLQAGWVYDEERHRTLNTQGRNYWSVYISEILSRLGLTAQTIHPAALADSQRIGDYSLLFIGRILESRLPEGAASVLSGWVAQGGVLVGFATQGLDDLFGVEAEGWIDQPQDEFSISGYFRFSDLPLTTDIHSDYHPSQPLVTVSPLRRVTPTSSEVVANLLLPASERPGKGEDAEPTPWAAITQRQLGSGWAFYFAFDVAQTMWTIHQGRPVDADYDGDGYLRAGDARIIAENETEVGYTDELHFLLQKIIGLQPLPLIHQIPPVDGGVADVLFFFGGDDEAAHGIQVTASGFMKSRNLPYHINLMPVEREFGVSADEIEQIESNGHELSLHYDFMTGFEHPTGFSEQDVKQQAELFRQAFGRAPVCTVNHCCRWTGWCEPARWMVAVGQKADNSWIGAPTPPINPVNTIDFSFGTAFPRHVWEDWAHSNERLDFVVEPITAYEVGYLNEDTDFDILHRAVDLAAKYRLTMNMFYHPVYIADYPACQQAIDELLRYIQGKGIVPAFMGNDALALWWLQRAEARVEQVVLDGQQLCDQDRPGHGKCRPLLHLREAR